MAGVVAKLGVHMGNKFVGCEEDGGHEAMDLANMCEKTMPFPRTKLRTSELAFKNKFKRWLKARDVEATHALTLPGGKYPHLCTMAPWVRDVCEGKILVVHINRPLEESIQSLIRRSGKKHDHGHLRTLQTKLWNDKHAFLQTNGVKHVTVEYDDLLRQPLKEVERVAAFLRPLEPTMNQIREAVKYVKPEKRHVK
jgi:hypothetical protein